MAELPRSWRKEETKKGTRYLPCNSINTIFFPIGDGRNVCGEISQNQAVALLNSEDSNSHSIDWNWKIAYKIVNEVSPNAITLPNGQYTFHTNGTEDYLIPLPSRVETYVHVGSNEDEINGDVYSFLENKALYDSVGSIYKRGILLYGPPGNGKSTIIRKIVNDLINNKREAIAIYTNSIPNDQVCNTLRNDPRLKVIVFEEIREMSQGMKLNELLQFLDGELTLSNCLIFATTNYSAELPANLVNRPSRFDLLYKVGSPDANGCKRLLELYLGRPVQKNEIDLVEGCSAALIKEICIQSIVQKSTLKDVLKLANKRAAAAKKDFGEVKTEMSSFGFGNRSKEDD